MVYLISRHPGAVDWILANTSLNVDKIVTHLDSAEELVEGDIIIGTLPINMIANVISKGARYIHLVVPVGQHLRGQELTKEQMDTIQGITLQEYVVKEISDNNCQKF